MRTLPWLTSILLTAIGRVYSYSEDMRSNLNFYSISFTRYASLVTLRVDRASTVCSISAYATGYRSEAKKGVVNVSGITGSMILALKKR